MSADIQAALLMFVVFGAIFGGFGLLMWWASILI